MKYLFLTVALFFSYVVTAQIDIQFPLLEGESLTREFVTLPEDVNGKYTLIGLAFSKKSEKFLNGWFNPIYQSFIFKPDGNSLFAGNYDVNVFFVPMFTGAKRPAYEKVMQKVIEDIDPRLRPYVLFYKGTMKEYKRTLDFEGKELPYFYILNPNGKVIYTTSGQYSDRKMQIITEKLEPAWN
ncbi:MAG: hypothetical protein ACO2ZZ_06575 [Cyclobacteriaceae bacterium]